MTYDLADRPFALALMRAYNDWLLDDFCSADPNRLLGLPLIPVDDGMDVLLASSSRVVDKGAKGVFIPYYPAALYSDAFYEPFWAACIGRGDPRAIHRVMGGKPTGRGRPEHLRGSGRERRRDRPTLLHRGGTLHAAHVRRRVPTLRRPEAPRCRGERRMAAVLGPDDGPGVRAPPPLVADAAADERRASSSARTCS